MLLLLLALSPLTHRRDDGSVWHPHRSIRQ